MYQPTLTLGLWVRPSICILSWLHHLLVSKTGVAGCCRDTNEGLRLSSYCLTAAVDSRGRLLTGSVLFPSPSPCRHLPHHPPGHAIHLGCNGEARQSYPASAMDWAGFKSRSICTDTQGTVATAASY